MPSIVDIGRYLESHGLNIGGHRHLGDGHVGRHSANSLHYSDSAIDVRDRRPDQAPEYQGGPNVHWQERTRRLAARAKQLGVFQEAFGPQDRNGHDTHTHLGLRGRASAVTPEALEWLATGRYRRRDGGFDTTMPQLSPTTGGTATGGSATGGTTTGGNATGGTRIANLNATAPLQTAQLRAAPVAAPPVAAQPDWRDAASNPSRSTDPTSKDYWEREDMKQWAAANPNLAAPLLAAAGLQTPTPQAPGVQAPQLAEPQVAEPRVAEPRVAEPQVPEPPVPLPPVSKPIDRGALNGSRSLFQRFLGT